KDWINPMPWPARVLFDALWAAAAMAVLWQATGRRPEFRWAVAAIFAAGSIAVSVFIFTLHYWWPWLTVGAFLPLLGAYWLRWKPAPLPFDVFISYRNSIRRPSPDDPNKEEIIWVDGDFAQRLSNALKDLKAAFYAPEDLPPGYFPGNLKKMINFCQCFVIVLSPRTFCKKPLPGEEDWVEFEIKHARSTRTIIPVLKDGFRYSVDMPKNIRDLLNWENLHEITYDGTNVKAVAEEIIRSVKSELRVKSTSLDPSERVCPTQAKTSEN
ncbi:MAG TPA: toll/interleukin-1 receptor domain-containing protein, partial [Verrucomicrobiae bacterium]|nr:toll/interleukin-1 receptor domain-containing protein [Verrucomicrobiae bacterium]